MLTSPLSLFVKKGQYYIQSKQRLVDGVFETYSHNLFKKLSDTECLDLFDNTVSLIVGSPACTLVPDTAIAALTEKSASILTVNMPVKIVGPNTIYCGKVGTIVSIYQTKDSDNVWYIVLFSDGKRYSFFKENLQCSQF